MIMILNINPFFKIFSYIRACAFIINISAAIGYPKGDHVVLVFLPQGMHFQRSQGGKHPHVMLQLFWVDWIRIQYIPFGMCELLTSTTPNFRQLKLKLQLPFLF